MTGKSARRARALRRSQEATATRLAGKRASAERDEHESEFDRLMHELRDERAEAMKDANAAYEKVVKAADKDRRKAVQKADAEYVEKRDEIIKRLAAAQDAAA